MKLRIKEILKMQKRTTVSLAKEYGMSQPNMSNIVNGRTVPGMKTLEKIAECLQVPINDLFESDTKLEILCPHCGKAITLNIEK